MPVSYASMPSAIFCEIALTALATKLSTARKFFATTLAESVTPVGIPQNFRLVK